MNVQSASETTDQECIDAAALKRHLGALQNKAVAVQALLNAAQSVQNLGGGLDRSCDLLELSTELATELNRDLDIVSLKRFGLSAQG